VVWPPAPGAAEIPEPPVTAEPELLAEPEEADESSEVSSEEPVRCDAAFPVELPEPEVLGCDEPGRA
jgi:hypothetical protein